MLVFEGILYKNITGNYTSTDPSLDTINWSSSESNYNDVAARLDSLESTLIKVSYYAEIFGVSGQIVIPTGAQVLFNQWSDNVDAIVSDIVGGKPDFLDTGLTVTSFDDLGNFTISGPIPSNPTALVYVFNIPFSDYKNLNKERIITYAELNTTTGTGTGTPMYIQLLKLTQSEGDLHFADAGGWGTSKALIKNIKVVTDSTDWDLYILQNSNGFVTDDALIPAKLVMSGGNGTEAISMDYTYEDEDNSATLHLYWVDNADIDTADFYITGIELT